MFRKMLLAGAALLSVAMARSAESGGQRDGVDTPVAEEASGVDSGVDTSVKLPSGWTLSRVEREDGKPMSPEELERVINYVRDRDKEEAKRFPNSMPMRIERGRQFMLKEAERQRRSEQARPHGVSDHPPSAGSDGETVPELQVAFPLNPGSPEDTDSGGAPPESRASVPAQRAAPESPSEASKGGRTSASEQAPQMRRRADTNTGLAWFYVVPGLVGAVAVGAAGMWLLLRRRAS